MRQTATVQLPQPRPNIALATLGECSESVDCFFFGPRLAASHAAYHALDMCLACVWCREGGGRW